MKCTKNKNGFTLIELLAVIVILAIIILIAVQNVNGMTATARKRVLAIEGNTLIDGAKNAYQFAILDGKITTGSACFSLNYLYTEGLFSKGTGDGYNGSVLVEPDASNDKIFNYHFWISNKNYVITNAALGDSGNGSNVVKATGSNAASSTCGNKTGVTKF